MLLCICLSARKIENILIRDQHTPTTALGNGIFSYSIRNKRDTNSINQKDVLQNINNLNEGINLQLNSHEGEALNNINSISEDIQISMSNVEDVASKQINQIGEESTKQLNKFGDEAMKGLQNFGDDAAKQLNKFGGDASEQINTAMKNFEGTANDFSNYANKKSQESLDDVQQWFKDKLVFYSITCILRYLFYKLLNVIRLIYMVASFTNKYLCCP